MAAVYPGAVATNADLLVANDNITTNLISPMLIGDSVAVVTSTTGWSAYMVATVGSEQMLVTSVTGANVLNVTRGYAGTSAAAHANNSAVSNFVDAVYHNNVRLEVEAIETTLGANMENVPGSPSGGIVPVAKGGTGVAAAQGVGGSKVQLADGAAVAGNVPKYDANGALIDSGVTPSVTPTGTAPFQSYRSDGFTPFNGEFIAPTSAYVPDFDFAAQTPGGTLTGGGGLQSITLTPCPIGIIANGAYASTVYISNGTGTAEACVCSGGTATSGSPSGTIQISPANNHSGSWTVTSATGGLQEALNYQYLTYAGGLVTLNPEGVCTVHARVSFPTGSYTVDGLGGATARIDRATDYPSGDLLYLNPSSTYYTIITNVRFRNNTAAAQSSGAAVACVLNRLTMSNISISGGYEGLRLDGAPGANISCFDMQRDLSADHTSALIRLTAAVSGMGSTDVVIGPGQLFASDTSVGLDIQAVDGLTVLGVQGGGGNPGVKMLPGGITANGFYLANIDIIGLLWDTWKNGAAGIYISGRSASGAGDISIIGGRLLGNTTATGGGGSYAVLIVPGTGSTPGGILIEGVMIRYTDEAAIQQNGLGLLPTQIIGNSIMYTNLGAHASTPSILLNGANASIRNNYIASTTATWQIGCESTCGAVEIVGNSLVGAITDAYTLDFGFSQYPTSLNIGNNLGVDNVIGTLASAATITLPSTPNFTMSGTTTVTALTAPTSGVGWAWPGRSGVIVPTGTFSFSSGSTIGNTYKALSGIPFGYLCDGTKIWLHGLSNTVSLDENYIASETGSNNAIAGAITGATLADGLRVTIQLGHTLQAGANTFNLNGGGAVAIKSSRNTANNISVAYAATGRITLEYSSTLPCWVDLSQ